MGVGCGYATFYPLVCFLAGFAELGGDVDASFVVVCERIQSFQMEKLYMQVLYLMIQELPMMHGLKLLLFIII